VAAPLAPESSPARPPVASASPAAAIADRAPVEEGAPSPSVAAASGDRDTRVEERRRTRRQRARARARARHRRDAQMTPAALEAATTPDDPASEPDRDNAVKAAPCSKDDPLCAFGTAR
jgi:hypothetical protein